MKSSRELLIDMLRNIPQHMKIKLECLREIGAIVSTRDDLVWYMLLQSMSGMGNNRGYKRLMLNAEKFYYLRWKTIKDLPQSERLDHITSVLSDTTVRRHEIKAKWLLKNFLLSRWGVLMVY